MTTDTNEKPVAEMTVTELAAGMHAHLEATEQLPIDPTANRWLGEAEAAAADVADGSAPESVVHKRATQVRHLLQSAGDTDHEPAEDHVDAALAMATELVERFE